MRFHRASKSSVHLGIASALLVLGVSCGGLQEPQTARPLAMAHPVDPWPDLSEITGMSVKTHASGDENMVAAKEVDRMEVPADSWRLVLATMLPLEEKAGVHEFEGASVGYIWIELSDGSELSIHLVYHGGGVLHLYLNEKRYEGGSRDDFVSVVKALHERQTDGVHGQRMD